MFFYRPSPARVGAKGRKPKTSASKRECWPAKKNAPSTSCSGRSGTHDLAASCDYGTVKPEKICSPRALLACHASGFSACAGGRLREAVDVSTRYGLFLSAAGLRRAQSSRHGKHREMARTPALEFMRAHSLPLILSGNLDSLHIARRTMVDQNA